MKRTSILLILLLSVAAAMVTMRVLDRQASAGTSAASVR
jgi:hypothetical protein